MEKTPGKTYIPNARTIAEVLYKHLDRTAGPHPFLRDKVNGGKLGMKTGEGMRTWTPEQAEAVRARLSRFLAEQAKARRRSLAGGGRATSL